MLCLLYVCLYATVCNAILFTSIATVTAPPIRDIIYYSITYQPNAERLGGTVEEPKAGQPVGTEGPKVDQPVGTDQGPKAGQPVGTDEEPKVGQQVGTDEEPMLHP
jgi:hypothetical protein